jgi:hypothetical protein
MNYTQLQRMPDGLVLIYKIENINTGSAYIGSTVEPKRRWRCHRLLLRKSSHTSFILQRAWNKHGEDCFTFQQVAVCSPEDRNSVETEIISKFGVYNYCDKAGVPPSGAMFGKKHSSDGLRNLRDAALMRWEREYNEKYKPLCEAAWELVCTGVPKYKACKAVGLSHSTFWKWISVTGNKEAWNR